MAKTINQIITELTSKGYNIKAIKRKDGGYLITKINGMKFKGATGNKVAREMVGVTLSSARKAQLERITASRYQYGKEVAKEYKRIATLWRKASLPKSAGKITYKKFKNLVKNEGLDEAMRYLGEKERYASGIAYSKNVQLLVEAIRKYANQLNGYKNANELFSLADEILALNMIKEDSINAIYYELYRFNRESLTEELILDVVKNVRSIIQED